MIEEPKLPVIGLITDFGDKDWYVSQMKGAIQQIEPDARIIDLTHHLEAFKVEEASFVVAKAARYFPKGSVFVVVVDPGVGTERKGIAVETKSGNIFVGPDNGVLSYVYAQQGVAKAHLLEEAKYFLREQVSTTFHGRDIFGPVAAHLANGVPMTDLGPEADKLLQLELPKPVKVDNRLKGEVVYIDHYGNAITNITREEMQDAQYDLLVKVRIGSTRASIPYVETYGKGPTNKRLFCLINSEGDLEFSVNSGNAAKALKLKVGNKVEIQL
ncbi:MAG: SAM-dependent chlorinase/fluorinase [Verrucomicrobiota bacterium]